MTINKTMMTIEERIQELEQLDGKIFQFIKDIFDNIKPLELYALHISLVDAQIAIQKEIEILRSKQ
jgi:hypothetical protein